MQKIDFKTYKYEGMVVVACLSLIGIHFFRNPTVWGSNKLVILIYGNNPGLLEPIFWSIVSVLGYMFLPFLYSKICLQVSLKSLGFKSILKANLKKYLWYYLAMIPLLIGISFLPAFTQKYPFYKFTTFSLTNFLVWEFFYLVQFIALEFFFRGFLVLGFKPILGKASVWLMILPYCMIHFEKPLPEAVASIAAGFILGNLSYKTNNIVGGIMLHFLVAITMDVLSLMQTGVLG